MPYKAWFVNLTFDRFEGNPLWRQTLVGTLPNTEARWRDQAGMG